VLGAHVNTTKEGPCEQLVGIDLHRRRSVIVRLSKDGERLERVRIVNDVDRLRAVLARAGESPDVVLEAWRDHPWHTSNNEILHPRTCSCQPICRYRWR
jgi:hypothetical protein